MDACNVDTDLITLLITWIWALLSGTDPWSVLASAYELAVQCGHTIQP